MSNSYSASDRAARPRPARVRSARIARFKTDVAYVLAEVEAVLVALPNRVVVTPSGMTTVKDIAGHVQRLLRRCGV